MSAATVATEFGLAGDAQCVYLLGRCEEYLGTGNLLPYLQELIEHRKPVTAIEEAVASVPDWATKVFPSLYQFRFYRILLYALVRAEAPNVVVETGVLHGMTSVFILQALAGNAGKGVLVSVDLPSYFETGPANRDGYEAVLPKGKQPGWMVPECLNRHWRLELGSSQEVLPRLEERTLDMFIHDSEHTYETMTYELEFAWERLCADGLLVCDNIESCSAFSDFCRKVGRDPLLLPAPDLESSEQLRFGLLRRSP